MGSPKLTPRKTGTRAHRPVHLFLKNIDGVVPEELYEFTEKAIHVSEIEGHLVELEKVE